jgi:hypothetical protein
MQNGRVAATPRQLEAMIRISEALARMHLRTEVGTSLTSAVVPQPWTHPTGSWCQLLETLPLASAAA